jgi:hypothetical protein
MRKQRPIFAFFAAAILFSMIREWNALSACARIAVGRTNQQCPVFWVVGSFRIE